MIAIAHLTQPMFSVGWPNLTDDGKPALVMLFLLSGLVIRYVTVLRRGRMTDFWVDRISRVYSVVLPALLFTIVASYVALWVNPAYYIAHWGTNDHPFRRVIMNLLFLAQSWNLTISAFSNDPFWTLSYEVFYYVFYAVGLYLAGTRRVFWLIVTAVLAGQHILLLLPLWLIGCAMQDAYQRLRRSSLSLTQLNLRFLGSGIAGAILTLLLVRALLWAKQPVTLFFWAHHHAPANLHWAYIYYIEGVPLVFGLLWLMLLLEHVSLAEKARWVGWVRLLSEATFPLYLLHFPMFVLITALFPGHQASVPFKLGMLVTCIGISALLARPTVQFKNYLRDQLRRYVFHAPLVPATPRLETAKAK